MSYGDPPWFAKNFPAFPSEYASQNEEGYHCVRRSTGMTLRDWFAGQALIGMLASTRRYDSCVDYAAASYKYADAMLVERDKSND